MQARTLDYTTKDQRALTASLLKLRSIFAVRIQVNVITVMQGLSSNEILPIEASTLRTIRHHFHILGLCCPLPYQAWASAIENPVYLQCMLGTYAW